MSAPSFRKPWVYHGSCMDWLQLLPSASVDAVVSDPPYGLGSPPDPQDVMRAWLAGEEYLAKGGGFMGRSWDSFVPGPEIWKECYRVLKPGGHLIAFSSMRTVDWLGLALRFSGFEVRDTIVWHYRSGMPKSMDVSKAIDKAAGAERKVTGHFKGPVKTKLIYGKLEGTYDITEPATPEAQQWKGWGTGLKPAGEPAILVRKPPEGSIMDNVLTHGTGALNIDATRFPPGADEWVGDKEAPSVHETMRVDGRWPANLIYVSKPTRRERDRGTAGLPLATPPAHVNADVDHARKMPHAGTGRSADSLANDHPTIKPVRLMRWCVRLITPPGGVVIDPFLGSGTTGIAAVLEDLRFGGSELQERYHQIARARIQHALMNPDAWLDTRPFNPNPW